MNIELVEGVDLTEVLNISLYQPPIPAEIAGDVEGVFPSFLKKTDEERIQNLTDDYDSLKEEDWYVTEKLDGTSCTYFYDGEKFGVCGRNYEYKFSETNSLWKFAIDNDLPKKFKELYDEIQIKFCIQGELIGNGIQKNKYKLNKQEFYAFNLYDSDNMDYGNLDSLFLTTERLGIKTVPVLDENFNLPDTYEELLKYAEGKSILNDQTEREGIVVRTQNKEKSFKVISNKFLLKNGE